MAFAAGSLPGVLLSAFVAVTAAGSWLGPESWSPAARCFRNSGLCGHPGGEQLESLVQCQHEKVRGRGYKKLERTNERFMASTAHCLRAQCRSQSGRTGVKDSPYGEEK